MRGMSDAEDAKAIQDYLRNAGTQAAAAVDACKATLPPALLAESYALAQLVMAYVSTSSPDLATGRKLRDDFNALVAKLSAAGCGDVAKLISEAPPPVVEPPPAHQGIDWNLFGNLAELEGLAILWLIYELTKSRR